MKEDVITDVNTEALHDKTDDIVQLTNNLSNVAEDLSAASTQISNAWTSDTVDKESYLKVLNSNLTKIWNLISALNTLTRSLYDYEQRLKIAQGK